MGRNITRLGYHTIMEDFNARDKSEAAYVHEPVITNELQLFLQEIDILFNTEQFEVLGNLDMGMSLEQFLGKYSMSAARIKELSISQIKNNCFMNEFFNWEIDVQFINGSLSDIMMLTIVVKNQENSGVLKTVTFVYR